MVFSLALITWLIAEVLYYRTDLPLWNLVINLSCLSSSIAAISLYTFTVEYTSVSRVSGWLIFVFMLFPIFIQILLFLQPMGNLLSFVRVLGPEGLKLLQGPWLWIHTVYIDWVILMVVVVLAQAFFFAATAYRRALAILAIGSAMPIIFSMIEMFGMTLPLMASYSFLAFLLTGSVLALGILVFRILDTTPISRNRVIDGMNEGWIVIDHEYRLVDLNKASEAIIGVQKNKAFGKHIQTILQDWPNIIRQVGDERVVDMSGTVVVSGERRYLNLRSSVLKDQTGAQFGQLITWYDITDRRKAEKARQRARDEMFSLLHSISDAASAAKSIADFVMASIFQLAYSFNSQAGLIYLLDEASDPKDGYRLLLVAHFGFETGSVERFGAVSAEDATIAGILDTRETVLIEDAAKDERLPLEMQGQVHGCVVFSPMIAEGRLAGIIMLVRESGTFIKDELIRLSVAGERVAICIESDRRRELAIALSERQRLVRDLHDSVTQKLYGLVALTEASQAAMEAGSTELSIKSLPKIGENARQALKEMRLFLYELQPVDIEREGLIAALNKRLEAVEGHADVKARLLSDNDITLSLEKEVALYFIATEALNNTLKHSGAHSVTVVLKQGRANVKLEIIDDGRGFDPKNYGKGGLGLRNIRERAHAINGKYRLVTEPGKGTKISVTVQKDIFHRLPRKRRST